MTFRPNHFALFILNQNGSGVILQYEDYQTAKADYNGVIQSGLSAWLYPAPISSLTTVPKTSFVPPAINSAPKIFTAEQNVNSPGYDPDAGHPPLPRATRPGGPFGGDYEGWQNFCQAHPTSQYCTVAPNAQFGQLISWQCMSLEEYNAWLGFGPEAVKDKEDTSWPNAMVFSVNKYSDGLGGYYLELQNNGEPGGESCPFPDGYVVIAVEVNEYLTNSNNPKGNLFVAIGSYVSGLDNNPEASNGVVTSLTLFGDSFGTALVANGQGGLRPEVRRGIIEIIGTFEDKKTKFTDYVAGAEFMSSDQLPFQVSPISSQGVSVHYASNAHNRYTMSYGKWFASFVGYADDVNPRTAIPEFWYVPDADPISPYEVIPPPGMCGLEIRDPYTNELVGINNTHTIPVSKTEETVDHAYVEINGTQYEVGIKFVTNVTSRGTFYSPVSDWEYLPSGSYLTSDETYNYFSDGNGSYYSEEIIEPPPPPPCPEAGLFIRYDSYPITNGVTDIQTQQYMVLGTMSVTVTTDGNCGETSADNPPPVWVSVDTIIGNDGTYDYYSDGNGGYYTVNPCPTQGTVVGSWREDFYNSGIPVGYQEGDKVANGDCTYYNSAGSFYYYPADQQVFSDGTYNYFSDGAGGFYILPINNCENPNLHSGEAGWSYDGCHWSYSSCEDPALHAGETGWSYDGCNWSYTDPGYPPAGTVLGTYDAAGATFLTNCGEFSYGTAHYTTYADGQNGYYDEESGVDWPSYGTYIGSCEGFDYYSSGDGSFYVSGGCPSSGEVINSGQDPITYDAGCGTWTIGYSPWTDFTDGNCGSYRNYDANQYNTGYVNSCNGYAYYVDSNGTVTSQPEQGCPSAGEYVNFGNDDIYVSTNCWNIRIGSVGWNEYTDGNCGTYRDYSASSIDSNYSYNGAYIGECDGYTYLSDGQGSYYTQYNQTCDPAGNFITGGQEDITVSTSCWTVVTGNQDFAEYTDGNCGSYRNYGSPVFNYMQGDWLGTCGNDQYYFDGNGGFYTILVAGLLVDFGTSYNYLYSDCWTVTLSSTSYENYSDGTGGTYTSYGETSYAYPYADESIGECNGVYYYSDGNGGYYSY